MGKTQQPQCLQNVHVRHWTDSKYNKMQNIVKWYLGKVIESSGPSVYLDLGCLQRNKPLYTAVGKCLARLYIFVGACENIFLVNLESRVIEMLATGRVIVWRDLRNTVHFVHSSGKMSGKTWYIHRSMWEHIFSKSRKQSYRNVELQGELLFEEISRHSTLCSQQWQNVWQDLIIRRSIWEYSKSRKESYRNVELQGE